MDMSQEVSMEIKVLIIEDESELRDVLASNLEMSGCQVLGLENGQDILRHLENFKPDIILLDQMMPGKSGQELIRDVRAQMRYADIPIMMVTGLNSEEQIVAALNMGADDYLTKPFSMRELQARTQALVRRARVQHRQQQQNIAFRELQVDLRSYKVTLRGHEVALTLTEFKILCELIRQSGQVLTRDRLREKALNNLNVTDRTIDVHMASLRKKLDDMGHSIETVRGVGYRMAT
jgi:DNA-binding response OmpR family regulator